MMNIEAQMKLAEEKIGCQCVKTSKSPSPKPFKSGKKVNTINSVIVHPELNIPAYTFDEDDSYVECRRCVILPHILESWFTGNKQSKQRVLTYTEFMNIARERGWNSRNYAGAINASDPSFEQVIKRANRDQTYFEYSGCFKVENES